MRCYDCKYLLYIQNISDVDLDYIDLSGELKYLKNKGLGYFCEKLKERLNDSYTNGYSEGEW